MAIVIPYTPQNVIIQSANQNILISWDLSPGATSYQVYRSTDNFITVNILLATLSGSPLITNYLDTSPVLATQYWYQVVAVNINGSSPASPSLSAVSVPTGEFCLSQLRLAAMQRADRVNSNFVTLSEWNSYINQSMFELYDLLITTYEDYFLAPPIQFNSDGTTFLYPLPNGSNTFLNALNLSQTVTPPAFYKLSGCDLALATAANAYVTINKFNFIDRNRFVYPNTSSTIYGIFNLRYRIMGSNIEFIPTPSAGQAIRLWYIPRITQLLLDTDTTTVGISGWAEYIIVKAAYYALCKEESDTTNLTIQLVALQKRIEETASNRDNSMPDTISDTRSALGAGYGGMGNGWNGSIGGF